MKNANQICTAVTEALNAGKSVFLTDGTVTREVAQVEISSSGFTKDTLDVLITDGCGNKVCTQIRIVWPWDDLDSYGMVELDGALYIAPDRWIEI